jgi:hypothetical protein
MKSKFLSLVSAALLLSPTDTVQTGALQTWSDTYVPLLENEARALLSGPFGWSELGQLAETAVKAAQELKGIFKGTPRATIAQVLLREAVVLALPDNIEHWALPLVNSSAVTSLIEAAFQRVFGPEVIVVSHAPVVDAPEITPGGIQ